MNILHFTSILFATCIWLTAPTAFAATFNITGSGFSFSPNNVTVTNGDTVVWTLVGTHTVSPKAGSGTTEPFCGPNAVPSCTVTFNAVGAFPFQCNIHAGFNMTGLVTVVAAPNLPPVVTLTNPAAETLFRTPGLVPIFVSASDPDGSIAYVRVVLDGVVAGSNAVPPYNFTLTNVPAGRRVVRAIATDNLGQSANTTNIFIRIVAPPSLSFARTNNGPLHFSFNTMTNVNYVVEGSVALTNFSPIVTNPGNNAAQSFVQTNPAPAERFFRLRLE